MQGQTSKKRARNALASQSLPIPQSLMGPPPTGLKIGLPGKLGKGWGKKNAWVWQQYEHKPAGSKASKSSSSADGQESGTADAGDSNEEEEGEGQQDAEGLPQKRKAEYHCKHCSKWMSGLNENRMKLHLINLRTCSFLDSVAAKECTAEEVQNILKSRAGKSSSSSASQGRFGAKAFQLDSISPQEKEELDKRFIAAVIDAGLAFSITENEAVIALFERLRPAYKIPSRHELAGRLLYGLYQAVYSRVQSFLRETEHLTVLGDGWSETQGGTHLIGWCAASFGSAVFLDAELTGAERVTSAYMVEAYERLLDKHGLRDKVVALVTDTPASMKKMWGELEDRYPKLIATGCWAHILQLFLNDVGDRDKFKAQLKRVRRVVKVFNRNTVPNALLREQQQQLGIKSGLSLDCATRFSSKFQMVKSVLTNKQALRSAVVQEKFPINKDRCKEVKEAVLGEDLWDIIEFLHNMLESTCHLILAIQSDKSNLADVHWALYKLDQFFEGAVDDVPAELAEDVKSIHAMLKSRMDYGEHPAIYLAAMLDPRYYSNMRLITKEERKVAESELLNLAGEGDKNSGGAAAALAQFGRVWRSKDGIRKTMKLEAAQLSPELTADPVAWWEDYGDEAPLLKDIAKLVLSIPPTSCAGERLFSQFSNLWDRKRKRLLVGRMWLMAYIYFNTRVMNRRGADLDMATDEQKEEFAAWLDTVRSAAEEEKLQQGIEAMEVDSD